MDGKAREAFLRLLRERFEANPDRHRDIDWADALARIEANPGALESLRKMEDSGGEPDVVDFGGEDILFVDCSPESPAGRRGLCYDREALESRKEHRPAGSAAESARDMGIELLDEERYRALQRFGAFDSRTSSWIGTPARIRKLGGALFADRRYGTVFVYHNGAESYYSVRGFRGLLRLP